MKPFYRQPVLLFGIIFASLIVVQSYYLWNTVQLWRSELNREVQLKLKKISESEFSTKSDDISARALSEFEQRRISEADFLKKYVVREQFKDANISSKIDDLFKKDGYQVGFAKEITSIYSYQSKSELLTKPVTLFTTRNSAAGGKTISDGEWDTKTKNHDSNHPNENEDYRFLVKDRTFFKILNIDAILVKKLAPQILLNILLCGLILYIFSQTLKNLQRQQGKIAELHTTIDSISHELNTPVSTLKFSVASMQASDFKSVLQRQISRIENISGQISRRHENHSLLDLELTEDYFKNIRSMFPVINFQIVNDFKFNKTISTEDFELILDNLVGNSVKYGASKIEINTIFADEILFKIHDDGMGIPANETENIFKKYYRVPRPENLNINGLGLGLFLVKETVNKYGGEITVQQHAGNGCLFLIKIPQI